MLIHDSKVVINRDMNIKNLLLLMLLSSQYNSLAELPEWGTLFIVPEDNNTIKTTQDDTVLGTRDNSTHNHRMASISKAVLQEVVANNLAFYQSQAKRRSPSNSHTKLSSEIILRNAKDLIIAKSKQLIEVTQLDAMEHSALLGINESGDFILSQNTTNGNMDEVNPFNAELPHGYELAAIIHTHPDSLEGPIGYIKQHDEYTGYATTGVSPNTGLSRKDIYLAYSASVMVIAALTNGDIHYYYPPENSSYPPNSKLPIMSYAVDGTFGTIK